MHLKMSEIHFAAAVKKLNKTNRLPFEFGGEVLGQGLGEALPSDAVVGVRAEDPEHAAVDLQRRHAEGRPAQLVHEDVAVDAGAEP